MKRVALFTTFFEVTSGYSLASVAETQLRALLDHGYDPVVLVQEDFECGDLWSPEYIDIRPVVPRLALVEDVAGDFEDRVVAILKALRNSLEGVDVCITHDIILQQFFNHGDMGTVMSSPGVITPHYTGKSSDTAVDDIIVQRSVGSAVKSAQ